MSFCLRKFLVLIFILPAAVGAASQGTQQTKQQPMQLAGAVTTGRISGRVLRADTAQPLGKAVVTIWSAEQPRETLSTRTDSSGNFDFRDLAPGTYHLRARRRGFVTQVYGQRGSGPGLAVSVGAGEHKSGVNFALTPAGVITGTIFDEDYEPVEDVEVAALRLRFQRGGKRTAQFIRTTRTNDLGQYRLAGLEPGFYIVQAAGRGQGVFVGARTDAIAYVPAFYGNAAAQEQALPVQVVAGRETLGVDISVRAAPTYTISGVIVDSSVGSSRKRYSIGFARGAGIATMESRDTSFSFPGLSPGEYTLVAIASEENGASRRGYLRVRIADSDQRVAVTIGQSAGLRGQARMEDNQPFSFAGLRLSAIPEIEDAPVGFAILEEDGSFAIRELPEGQYTFELSGRETEFYLKQVECSGQDYSNQPAPLKAGETLECTLLLSRDVGEVRGQVEQEGEPAPGMVVVLIPRSLELRLRPRYTMTAQTDDHGQFQIRGVIPGEYLAFALAPVDDASYFALDFAERNRDAAVPLTVKTEQPQLLRLQVIAPR
jgi:protocatechuate 3,4-dioxygenase beta subunit